LTAENAAVSHKHASNMNHAAKIDHVMMTERLGTEQSIVHVAMGLLKRTASHGV
jgi:hypothetical protein